MSFFKGFRSGFQKFGHRISTIVNFVLLVFAYYIGIGLTALLTKILGKHVLDLYPSKKKKTYWVKHPKISDKMEDYYRQF